MASDISHPMGDPGRGTVPYLAADMVDVAAAETVRTAEAEVGVGGNGPTTNPPHQDRQKKSKRSM